MLCVGIINLSSKVWFGWNALRIYIALRIFQSYHHLVDVVYCGLTSHSAIFQLYSDGTDVQFPNFDLLPGTPPWAARGL